MKRAISRPSLKELPSKLFSEIGIQKAENLSGGLISFMSVKVPDYKPKLAGEASVVTREHILL